MRVVVLEARLLNLLAEKAVPYRQSVDSGSHEIREGVFGLANNGFFAHESRIGLMDAVAQTLRTEVAVDVDDQVGGVSGEHVNRATGTSWHDSSASHHPAVRVV